MTKLCGTSNAYHVEHSQSWCTAEARNRFQVALSDDVGLHIEFGRPFFFAVTSKHSVVTVETTIDRRRSVTEVLMN